MTSVDRLLSIGQFARRSGLTAKTLRHYDSVGLLEPAVVEQGNGYRRYRADQVTRARQIRKLRDLELPLAEVRRLLALHAASPEAMTNELLAHRRMLDSRLVRL
jgi:DNA-binding transcriptional MerR regulator